MRSTVGRSNSSAVSAFKWGIRPASASARSHLAGTRRMRANSPSGKSRGEVLVSMPNDVTTRQAWISRVAPDLLDFWPGGVKHLPPQGGDAVAAFLLRTCLAGPAWKKPGLSRHERANCRG